MMCEFFSLVADQLAIALENARLFSERQQFEEQLLTSLREKEVLLKEIHHRVKNNLQVISSLLSLQADTSGDQHLRTLLGESRNRVRSMALVHERLYHSDDLGRVEFQEYVSTLAAELVRSFGHPGVTCTVQADPISLGIDTAVPCGLILNEMLTNALKHAFPGDMTGTVTIEVNRIDDEHVRLSVRDSGKGFPPEADSGPDPLDGTDADPKPDGTARGNAFSGKPGGGGVYGGLSIFRVTTSVQ